MRHLIQRVVNLGVNDEVSLSDAKHVRATNIVTVAAAAMLAPWIPISVWAGEAVNAAANTAVVASFLLVPGLNAIYRHRAAVMLALLTGHAQLLWAMLVHGVPSGSLLAYQILLVAPYLICRRADRGTAHAFALLAFALTIFFAAFAEQFPRTIVMIDLRYQLLMNAALCAAGLLLIASAFLRRIDETEDALQREQARADRLLLNVLPPAIVKRLKAAPTQAIAERCDEVTVLFADIVGFTSLSSHLSAAEIVDVLNRIFTVFDGICDRAGVYKIRTIGDGYMVVCGAPEPCENHAEVMTRVAIEMRDHIASNPVGEPLQLRIGLNSGEVVAGIIGSSRFQYDIWGDTVNVASRMESSGEPGRIHVTRATWERIRDQFRCVARGRIPIKGKGEMETWFVA